MCLVGRVEKSSVKIHAMFTVQEEQNARLNSTDKIKVCIKLYFSDMFSMLKQSFSQPFKIVKI